MWVTIWWRNVSARRTKVACTTHSSGRRPDRSIKRRDAVTTTSLPSCLFYSRQHVTRVVSNSEARWQKKSHSLPNASRNLVVQLNSLNQFVTRRSRPPPRRMGKKYNPFRLPERDSQRQMRDGWEWTISRIANLQCLCDPGESRGDAERVGRRVRMFACVI